MDQPVTGLSQVVPWGRSLDEYVAMFNLADTDRQRKLLGVADGPASFNAEWTARGGRVVSVDPIYGFTADEIASRIEACKGEILAKTWQTREHFLWTRFVSVEHLGVARMAAMEKFLGDYPTGRIAGRYVSGSLPQLPFDSGSFDLALCSHFLFTYSDILGADGHLAAVGELCRVAHEVRIFPLFDMFAGRKSPHLDAVLGHLQAKGWTVDVVTVEYEFQRGANQMLRISR
jgi:hypothetical protein